MRIALILTLVVGLVGLSLSNEALAVSKGDIDKGVWKSLKMLEDIKGGKDVEKKAVAMLVFPSVFKGGFVIGAEYGEGALLIDNKIVDYYNIAGGSFGFQLGGQKRTVIMAFMDQGAFNKFRDSSGWKVGADAAVTVIAVGLDGSIDTSKTNKPVIAFVFDKKGLMYNLTLEGAKVTKLNK